MVETGTNHGFSSIVLAQALKDSGRSGVVRTVEFNPALAERARKNIDRAGLTDRVEVTVGDALEFLDTLPDRLDFILIDDDHERHHVVREFERIYQRLVNGRGKAYFDNTTAGGVARALGDIHERFGGNLLEFASCSMGPPGNAIWQP